MQVQSSEACKDRCLCYYTWHCCCSQILLQTIRPFSKGIYCEIDPKCLQEYIQQRKKSQKQFYDCSLPEKKRRAYPFVRESIDKRLQLYLKAIRANRGPVNAGIAIAAARGLLLDENMSELFEYGSHIKLNRSWAYALINRMGMIQRKPTTSKSKMNMTDFAHRKRHFLMTLLQWSKLMKY